MAVVENSTAVLAAAAVEGSAVVVVAADSAWESVAAAGVWAAGCGRNRVW